jgi:hypothetical protein
MNPWLALAVAVTVPSSGIFALVWQAGRWAGSVNATLDELRRGHDDHETRLRRVEPAEQRRGGRRGAGL